MSTLASLLVFSLLAPANGEVRVFAAASLARVFTAAQSQAGASTLVFNFAGSQQLALQLSQGAQADVFASADERWMRDVEQRGLLAEEPRVFARNRLVVITPAANPGKIERLEDLARPGVKLVLAAAAVPAGQYSREVLAKLGAQGLGAAYSTRVLANLVSEEENVQAVLAKVRLGEADAGIVYVSDVGSDVGSSLRTIEIPTNANVVASYWIGVLKSAANPAGARSFVAWLGSDAGRRLLAEHGFAAGDSM